MSGRSMLVVAGEVSGDIHAANLVAAISALRPEVKAFGIGGERLRAAGLECLAGIEELAHMGLVEVVKEVPRIRRLMRATAAEAALRRPAVAVLVDSPDFNLRLGARLGRLGIPVVLYVSPQLWAWRRGRVRVVRRVAREVLCILPFEVGFYQRAGVAARFVGHPLVDDLEGRLAERVTRRPQRVALLPGSRTMEVAQLLPTMLEALRRLAPAEVEEAVVVEASGVGEAVDAVLAEHGVDPRLRRVSGVGRRRELAASGVAWTASGTATLECALLDVPMVVGYRLRAVSYLLARALVRVPHVALVNLIAGRRLAPELMQSKWRPSTLVETTRELLGGEAEGQRRGLAEVRRRLGPPGASQRAAEAVAAYL